MCHRGMSETFGQHCTDCYTTIELPRHRAIFKVRTNMQNWPYNSLNDASILVNNGCRKKKEHQSTTEETLEQASRESLASFSIPLPRELIGEMQRVASQHERSMNGEIVWALRAYVNNTRRKAATPVNATRTAQNFHLFDEWVESNPVVAYDTPEPDSKWVCLDCVASGTVGETLHPVRLDVTDLAAMIRYNIRYQEDLCGICGQDAFVDRRPPADDDREELAAEYAAERDEDKATEEDKDRAADEGMIDRKEEQLSRVIDHDDGE
jgi:hypothetical protein